MKTLYNVEVIDAKGDHWYYKSVERVAWPNDGVILEWDHKIPDKTTEGGVLQMGVSVKEQTAHFHPVKVEVTVQEEK